jgi:hypothetical protein
MARKGFKIEVHFSIVLRFLGCQKGRPKIDDLDADA